MKTQTKLVFTIVVISILLLVAILLCIYMYSSIYYQIFNTNLGNDLIFEINDYGNLVKSISYPSTLVGNLDYKQKSFLDIKDLNQSLYVRAKVSFSKINNEFIDIKINTSENWTEGEDGYYYFNQPIFLDDKIEIFDKITLINEQTSSKNSVLSVLVETLPIEFDVGNIWNTTIV